jgi:hypothetical protein
LLKISGSRIIGRRTIHRIYSPHGKFIAWKIHRMDSSSHIVNIANCKIEKVSPNYHFIISPNFALLSNIIMCGNSPRGESSIRWIVHAVNCPCDEFVRWIVRAVNRPAVNYPTPKKSGVCSVYDTKYWKLLDHDRAYQWFPTLFTHATPRNNKISWQTYVQKKYRGTPGNIKKLSITIYTRKIFLFFGTILINRSRQAQQMVTTSIYWWYMLGFTCSM